jgi:hypothetical protein
MQTLTLDRIKKIAKHYGGMMPDMPCGKGAHAFLNTLDKQAGYDTTGGRIMPPPACGGQYKNRVGVRVALHEIHVCNEKHRKPQEDDSLLFWGAVPTDGVTAVRDERAAIVKYLRGRGVVASFYAREINEGAHLRV